ncbi:MAG: thiamine pyrophosphate-dependent dehydrogenase E1 component subunit alpha [Oscillibacter sp.]|jgi:pyruvate dehydrogenase E1 component alpha subunit|nr:thiamine pyrophosphate-dependent dehydrogenase E1 component subunit alpha [Oscillibacter sp.]
MKYENDFLLKIHKELLEMRLLEAKMVDLYAESRVPGHIHSGMGQEAAFVGVLATRKPGDYFKLAHRVVSSSYLVGDPLDTFFGEILAKKTGNSGGRGGINHTGRLCDGVLGMSGTLGCDAAIPVGAAMTIEAEGRDNVAFFFAGDGATNRGPVYEAMTLAADWKLPVVFVCINNGFGISTPTEYSSPVPNVMADKAAGFNMPSVVVDGTNVLETYEGASKIVEGVRAGNGPAVIECKCYRWRGHFEGDQCAYRDGAVTQMNMEEKDCVKNFEKDLMDQGVLTADQIAEMRESFDKEMEASIAHAEAAPEMTADEIFDYLYV